MKTRRFFLYLIIYVGINLFASCENEIPYTPPYREPQLIMNALLDAGEHENFVFLSVSGIEGISHVETASLTLYINGQLAETPEELPPLKPIGSLDVVYDPDAPLNNLPEIAKRKKYRITTTLNPGDNIRLEAIAENGKYHATAEVTVPYPVNTIQVDTCLARLKEYNGWNTYRQFKITLQDRPNEKNHYRLDIRNDITVYGQYNNYKDTIVYSRYTDLINREDIILTDGKPSNSEDYEDDPFGSYIENKYNVFTDGRFSGSTCTLKVYTQLYNNDYSGLYNVTRRSKSITVRLLSISEAEFRYLKALNYLESDNYEEALMEPVIIPSNVKGGLGFVGISSETRMTMQLPDEIIDNENLPPYTQ
jgi:hypothetical protein|nr:DUF4249 domain-containing protein [Bacteroides intestinalis]